MSTRLEKMLQMDNETKRAQHENMLQLVNKLRLLVREERSLDELTPGEKTMLVEGLEEHAECLKPFTLAEFQKEARAKLEETMKDDTTGKEK